jgi:DNA-binding MarR family transcriptional regulator
VKASASKFCSCIYWTSGTLARKINKLAEEAWAPVGLAPGQAYMLALVIENPGCQPLELSAELHLAPSTITRFIEKLEGRKLVVRVTDGKLTNVFPTAAARKMKDKMAKCRGNFMDAFQAALGKKESEILVKHLVQAADKLDN